MIHNRVTISTIISRKQGVRLISNTWKPQMTFEGNTQGIAASDEERMKSVFGGRIKGEPPRSTSRILTGGIKTIAGVNVPGRPLEPDNCCMSGCVNCVWEIYNEDIRDWKEKRKIAADKIKGTNEIWPADWNPPLALLELQNIPESLHDIKIKYELQNQTEAKKIISKKETSHLFPKRTTPLPKSVIEAKDKHRLRALTKEENKRFQEIEDDKEGWGSVPVYIKAFAQFESMQRQKKLKKAQLSKEKKAFSKIQSIKY